MEKANLKPNIFILNGLHCANCAQKVEKAIQNDHRYQDVTFSYATKKLKLKSELDGKKLLDSIQTIVDSVEDGITILSTKPLASKKTLYLNGLNCAGCAAKVEDAIKNDSRYQEVTFSFATKRLQFESNANLTTLVDEIQSLVDDIEDGVTVATSKSGDKTAAELSNSSNEVVYTSRRSSVLKSIKKNYQMIIGAIIVFTVIITKPDQTIAFTGYVLSYLLIGHDVVSRAIKNLLKGNLFDEYFLMTIATIGAFALGEYTEAVMVMLFYKVGESFQDYAVDYSRRSIQSLLDIKAEFANLVMGSITKQVDPESLIEGDIILIKAGEKVPVDGLVLEGVSSLDTSALTGESLPRVCRVDDEVLSGTINKEGLLKVKVTKTYENSTVARILDMVENATSKKAKTEQFITKFAKVYTPIVVFMAVALALIPPLIGMGDMREWISRALIFLVISCPCALVISVPLGYFAGLGVASRQGILIKGGNYLEALNTIDTFVFDKTGTLTKGNFEVQKVVGEKTLELAALLEVHSTHPIALSIMKHYSQDVAINDSDDVTEIPGEGLTGTYNGKALIVGNKRLMNRYNIESKDGDYAGSVVHVAFDSQYVGAIYIADEVKEDAHLITTSLKKLGAKALVMLTGDQDRIANQVATELNFDFYHSQLLPQDKMTHVEAYIDEGSKVLFVGDGINDAPVLARADIGVAMGGLGSDAAIEAADIVLMTDEPTKLIEAKLIAAKTRKIVIQNIVFALGIKLFFLSLGAIGVATMYEAIFADVGVTVLAVLNSMRILKH